MKWLSCSMLFFVMLFSCSSYPKAEDAFDAARQFIDGCQKGDFDRAAFYMVPDETNKKQLENLKNIYRTKSIADKEQYKEASINILEEDAVSDTVQIINYKNSFDNIARKTKVVQRNGVWAVDLKYTFDGNL